MQKTTLGNQSRKKNLGNADKKGGIGAVIQVYNERVGGYNSSPARK